MSHTPPKGGLRLVWEKARGNPWFDSTILFAFCAILGLGSPRSLAAGAVLGGLSAAYTVLWKRICSRGAAEWKLRAINALVWVLSWGGGVFIAQWIGDRVNLTDIKIAFAVASLIGVFKYFMDIPYPKPRQMDPEPKE